MVVCAGGSGVSSRDGHDAVLSAPVPAQGLAGRSGVGGCDLTRALLKAVCYNSGREAQGMVAQQQIGPIWTVDQYLILERYSTVTHEYPRGYAYAMAGGLLRRNPR